VMKSSVRTKDEELPEDEDDSQTETTDKVQFLMI